MESCVGKTYDEITEIFLRKHGDIASMRALDMKWRKIGKLVSVGRK